DQDGLQVRNVGRRQELVIAQVQVGHAALVEPQVFAEGHAQPLDDAAIDLPLMCDRVKDDADIVRGDEAVHPQLAGLRVYLNLRDLGGEAGDLPLHRHLDLRLGAALLRVGGLGRQLLQAEAAVAVIRPVEDALVVGELLRRAAEQLGCAARQLLAQQLDRFERCVAIGVGDAHAADPLVRRHRVRIADADVHFLQRYLHLFGDDLLQHSMDAAALVEGRAEDTDAAVVLNGQRRRRWAGADMPLVHGDAAAVVWAGPGAVPVRGLEGGFQRLAGVYALQLLTHGVLIALAHQVAQPVLGYVHPQLLGDEVRVRLDREVDLRRARSAEETGGHGVGVDLDRLEEGVIDAVGPASVRRTADGDVGQRLHAAVGAGVVDGPQVAGHHAAVALDARADGDCALVAGVAGQQLLQVAHDDAHRLTGLFRQVVGDRQVQGVALAAEVTADVDRVHQDVLNPDL